MANSHATIGNPAGMRSSFSASWAIRGCKTFGWCMVFTSLISLCILFISLGASYEGRSLRRSRRRESPAESVEHRMLCDQANATMDDSERVLCEDYHRRKKDFYRLRNHKISEYTHRFIINGREICKPSTSVVLLVHSLHSYSDRRDAIRRTWGGASVRNDWPGEGNTWEHHVQLVFVFGAHPDKRENDRVLVESSDYGDIIQGDFHESYRNMTLKSLLGLKWVHEYCPSAKYIIKSDDDMVVNIPTLLKVIHKRGMSWAMMGPYNGRSRVYRAGKWRLRWEDFPFYFYPPYESGSCYVITADLAFPLFEAAEYVPHLFIDDVFITGILGSILNVTHIKQDGFAFWTNKKPQMCEIATNQIITGTKMTPTFMLSFWSDLKSYGPKCAANPDKDLLHPKNVTNKLK